MEWKRPTMKSGQPWDFRTRMSHECAMETKAAPQSIASLAERRTPWRAERGLNHVRVKLHDVVGEAPVFHEPA
eukprot:8213015-Pyramimonas_sp.AAC.1